MLGRETLPAETLPAPDRARTDIVWPVEAGATMNWRG